MITAHCSLAFFAWCMIVSVSDVGSLSTVTNTFNCPQILRSARTLSAMVRLAQEIRSGNVDVESQCVRELQESLVEIDQNSMIRPRRMKRQAENAVMDKDLMDAAIVLQALQSEKSNSAGASDSENLNIPVVEFDKVLRQIIGGRDNDQMKQLGEVMSMVDMYRRKAENASITANRALHTIRKMTAFVRSVAEQLSTRIEDNTNTSLETSQRLLQMEAVMQQLGTSTQQFNRAVTELTKKLYDRGLLSADSHGDNSTDEQRQRLQLTADVQPLGVLRSLDDPCSNNKQKEACVDLKQMFGQLMDDSAKQKEQDRMMHVQMKGMILDVAGLKDRLDNLTKENEELRQQVDLLEKNLDSGSLCCPNNKNNNSKFEGTTEAILEDSETSTMFEITTIDLKTTTDIDYSTQTSSTDLTTETDQALSTEANQEITTTEQESSTTTDITEYSTSVTDVQVTNTMEEEGDESSTKKDIASGYNYDPPPSENQLNLTRPQTASDDEETTEYTTEISVTDSTTDVEATSTTTASTETDYTYLDTTTIAITTDTSATDESTVKEITTEEMSRKEGQSQGYNYQPPDNGRQLVLPQANRPTNEVNIKQIISEQSPPINQQDEFNHYKTNQNQHQPNQNQYQPTQNQYQPDQDQYQPNQNQYQPNQNQYQPNQNQYQPNQNQYQPEQNQNQPNQNQYQPNQNQYQPNQNQYQPNQNQYQPNQNQYQPNQNQYKPNQNQYQPDQNQYQPSQNQYQPEHNQYQPDQNQYQPDQNQYQPDQNQYQPEQNQYQPNQNQYQPNQNQYQPNQNQYQPDQNQYQPNQNQQFSTQQQNIPQNQEAHQSNSDSDVRPVPQSGNHERFVVWFDDEPENDEQSWTRPGGYSSQIGSQNNQYSNPLTEQGRQQQQQDLSAAPSQQNSHALVQDTQAAASFRTAGQQEAGASRSNCRGSPSNPLPGLDVWCRNNCPRYCPRSHCVCDE